MDKKIIRNFLNTRFISEDSTPGIDVTKKVHKDSGKINKSAVTDLGKKVTDYDKQIKGDKEAGKMATNKFNYNGDKEKEYHEDMEILNGQEMIQYDREPNEEFKKRAKEAIEGSSRMGNAGGKGVGNAEETWGASSDDFGKNLVKRAASSAKKRLDAEKGIMSFGDDVEIVPKGSKPMAKHSAFNESAEFNGKIPDLFYPYSQSIIKIVTDVNNPTTEANYIEKSKGVINALSKKLGSDPNFEASLPQLYRYIADLAGISPNHKKNVGEDDNSASRNIEYGNPYGTEDEYEGKEKLKDLVNNNAVKENMGGVSEKTQGILNSWITEFGTRKAAINLIDNLLKKAIGLTSSDLTDSSTFANGVDEVEEFLSSNDFRGAIDATREIVRDMLEDEGYPMFENKNNNNKPQIKESMKRIKFNKPFNGVGNALKMIPESYRTDNKEFEMTDGNETYRMRWEGTLSEGRAVVLTAANKSMINEDMQKMKHLMGYKSQETLGLVKGNARLNENAVFGDIYKKTKALLEGEDIESQDAPEKDADESVNYAKEAKKHVEGSVSTDKGTQAPKPKTGSMESIDDAKSQAKEAKKHVEGSASGAKIGMGLGEKAPEGEWDQIDVPQAAAHGNPSNTTYAPKPTSGEWDKINVPQAADAKKHITMKEGIQLGENYFEEMEDPYCNEEEEKEEGKFGNNALTGEPLPDPASQMVTEEDEDENYDDHDEELETWKQNQDS